jgi:hypothetical protein
MSSQELISAQTQLAGEKNFAISEWVRVTTRASDRIGQIHAVDSRRGPLKYKVHTKGGLKVWVSAISLHSIPTEVIQEEEGAKDALLTPALTDSLPKVPPERPLQKPQTPQLKPLSEHPRDHQAQPGGIPDKATFRSDTAHISAKPVDKWDLKFGDLLKFHTSSGVTEGLVICVDPDSAEAFCTVNTVDNRTISIERECSLRNSMSRVVQVRQYFQFQKEERDKLTLHYGRGSLTLRYRTTPPMGWSQKKGRMARKKKRSKKTTKAKSGAPKASRSNKPGKNHHAGVDSEVSDKGSVTSRQSSYQEPFQRPAFPGLGVPAGLVSELKSKMLAKYRDPAKREYASKLLPENAEQLAELLREATEAQREFEDIELLRIFGNAAEAKRAEYHQEYSSCGFKDEIALMIARRRIFTLLLPSDLSCPQVIVFCRQ